MMHPRTKYAQNISKLEASHGSNRLISNNEP